MTMKNYLLLVLFWKIHHSISELCKLTHNISGIEVSPSTVCRLLHRHGFTHKRVRQIALQRSFELRGLFMAQVLLYDKDKFVWLDETGCNNSRKYGYAIRGETPHCHTMLVRGTPNICDCSNSI